LHPELAGLEESERLAKVPFRIVYANLDAIVRHYNDHLFLGNILNYYTGSDIYSGDVEKQVNCVLPSHGTLDKNKSARYYALNKETGLRDERVYCFKCLTSLSAFGFLYNYNKSYKNFNGMKDFFRLLKDRWGVRFPFEIVYDFDEESHYTFGEDERKARVKDYYAYAENALRPMFGIDAEAFKRLSREFLG
jgi:hypothetical protein